MTSHDDAQRPASAISRRTILALPPLFALAACSSSVAGVRYEHVPTPTVPSPDATEKLRQQCREACLGVQYAVVGAPAAPTSTAELSAFADSLTRQLAAVGPAYDPGEGFPDNRPTEQARSDAKPGSASHVAQVAATTFDSIRPLVGDADPAMSSLAVAISANHTAWAVTLQGGKDFEVPAPPSSNTPEGDVPEDRRNALIEAISTRQSSLYLLGALASGEQTPTVKALGETYKHQLASLRLLESVSRQAGVTPPEAAVAYAPLKDGSLADKAGTLLTADARSSARLVAHMPGNLRAWFHYLIAADAIAAAGWVGTPPTFVSPE